MFNRDPSRLILAEQLGGPIPAQRVDLDQCGDCSEAQSKDHAMPF
jgi:hypothetical protein